MKSTILNIIKYILNEYPHKSELSASRLTKILYLVDWKNAIDRGEQLTNATWHFNHYGPYVDDFVEMSEKDEDIEIENTTTIFGGKKKLFKLSKKFQGSINIVPEHQKIVDFVINATKTKNYEDFIHLVYSTYPVISSDKYNDLDLVSLAKEYREILKSNSNKSKELNQ